MTPYLPIRALNRSSAIRINKQRVLPGVTTYIDMGAAGVPKELAYHSSIGQVFAVGALTQSNVDQVVATGATTSVSNLVVTVAAGELKTRSTGVYVAVAGGTTTLSAADGTQDRTDLVWVDSVTGAQGHTNGTLAPAGTSVAPATPAGKVPVASYLVAATLTVATLVADLRPRA